MKCIRCGKEVVVQGRAGTPWMYGYKIKGGGAVHNGCALLMDEAPKEEDAR